MISEVNESPEPLPGHVCRLPVKSTGVSVSNTDWQGPQQVADHCLVGGKNNKQSNAAVRCFPPTKGILHIQS